jgi:hypothetical protein
MPRPTATIGLVTALATLALVGCGSSNATSTSARVSTSAVPGGPAATKAQFVAQAGQICRQLSLSEKSLKARQEGIKSLSTAAASKVFATVAQEVVTLSRGAEQKLQALPRPPGDEAQIAKLLAAYKAEESDVANIVYAVDHEESTTGEAAEQALQTVSRDNTALAESFGMKACVGAE